MFVEERHALIIQELKENGRVKVKELSAKFKVSLLLFLVFSTASSITFLVFSGIWDKSPMVVIRISF